MEKETVLSHLERLAHALGVDIRYESFEEEAFLAPGGLCRVKDRHLILLNRKSPPEDKVRTLVLALRRFDLAGVYLVPAVRELLENGSEADPPQGPPPEVRPWK